MQDPVAGAGRAEPAPEAPVEAAAVFGDRLSIAVAYVGLLADTGVTHGLIGPRETPRLWQRHVLNCAVMHPAIAQGNAVADVGSGAGLPGIPLAIARPDLNVHLVEPLLRRTTWLISTVDQLGLSNVTIHRGRAQDMVGILRVPAVTARAVAKLVSLAAWCLPLVAPGGSLLALKGAGASAELDEQVEPLRRLGVAETTVETYGEGQVQPATTVVRLVRAR